MRQFSVIAVPNLDFRQFDLRWLVRQSASGNGDRSTLSEPLLICSRRDDEAFDVDGGGVFLAFVDVLNIDQWNAELLSSTGLVGLDSVRDENEVGLTRKRRSGRRERSVRPTLAVRRKEICAPCCRR